MSVAPKTAAAMSAHWDGRAHRFEGAASHNRDRQAWREVLAAAVGPAPQHIVDLGCGTGACLVLLAGMGHRITGIDGSAAMLGEARRVAARDGVQVEFIHADMDRCGLPDGTADVVTLRNVLWTLENPPEALHLAVRLLRPGGKVLVSDGIWRRAPDPALAELTPHLPNACGVSEAEARTGCAMWVSVGSRYGTTASPAILMVGSTTNPKRRSPSSCSLRRSRCNGSKIGAGAEHGI